ncbi:MAG TPA: GTP-binding protein, partial [Pseudorhodoferax sp.]|nr:GTP-binding protein [Pseudorhodoferax sp.]
RAGHQQRHEQILVLHSALQQAGAQGLEEQRAALDGERQRALRRQHELQRRAAALDLLCERLQARRQATLARLQAPLAQRLQHYLPLLLPGASVQIDERLAPRLLTRPRATGAPGAQESGAVDALSFGAREQLGLISRFAYADLLQQAGRPTLLILDDALVHSDSERLASMKRVLFDAAQRHQVLLFTCHPALWRDMGVAVRTLENAGG